MYIAYFYIASFLIKLIKSTLFNLFHILNIKAISKHKIKFSEKLKDLKIIIIIIIYININNNKFYYLNLNEIILDIIFLFYMYLIRVADSKRKSKNFRDKMLRKYRFIFHFA